MTRLAFDLFVAAVKRKFRAAVMVEMPRQPGSRDVTAFALITQRALVDIFFLVTADAGLRCLAIACRLMARFARRRTMSSGHGKLRFVVIKECLGPFRVSVTRHAIFA